MLANRLKPILPSMISPMQNAFVSGRQIQNSIGIAHKLFHFLKLRKAQGKFEFGIKLDMHKAYDRVEWDFLDAVMEKMGFCIGWRRIVMSCLCTVSFAVILIGQLGDKFAPSRGLRQREPLCPYLFFLVSEVLSHMIQSVMDRKYLDAVQMVLGRSKRQGLTYIKERILAKLQGWKRCTLSPVRNEVLLNTVVQAIPAYPMSLFKFPARLCNELDVLIYAFWWGKAKRGGRASWLWSSLLVGRDLLLDRAHWQIMGGRDVQVWVDKWLLSLSMGHLVPRVRVFVSRNLSDDTLICPSTKSWDIDFLMGFMSHNEMATVGTILYWASLLGLPDIEPMIHIPGRIYVVPRPLRFCASTFGAVCGKRHEKLCRFSLNFSPPP
ncbi:hypothetical protein ACFX19_026088 [Malus domestica]